MFANLLKSTPFPSITGFPASAPIFPSPKTAVQFETTATRFPLFVYLNTSSGLSLIFKHGIATPGV